MNDKLIEITLDGALALSRTERVWRVFNCDTIDESRQFAALWRNCDVSKVHISDRNVFCSLQGYLTPFSRRYANFDLGLDYVPVLHYHVVFEKYEDYVDVADYI